MKYRMPYSTKPNSLSDSLEYVGHFDMIWLTVFLTLCLVDSVTVHLSEPPDLARMGLVWFVEMSG